MKNNTGIVMQIDKNNAFIMTNAGEFIKVKVGKILPNIGEVYTGKTAKKSTFYKYALTAASLVFILLLGSTTYAYYSPAASLEIDINPSIKIQVNRWDRIIKSIPLNKDGEKILTNLSIRNKNINTGLNLIVEEAKRDNFIDDKYTESGKAITLFIQNNNSKKDLNLSKFEESLKNNNLQLKIVSKESSRDNTNDNKAIKPIEDTTNNSNVESRKSFPSNPNSKATINNDNINKENGKKNNDNNSTKEQPSNANVNNDTKKNYKDAYNKSDSKSTNKNSSNQSKEEKNKK